MLSIDKRTAPYAALILRMTLGAILVTHGLSDERALPLPPTLSDADAISTLVSELLPVIEMAFGVLLILGIKTRAVAVVMVPVLFAAQLVNAHASWDSSARYAMWEYTIFLGVAGIAQALLGAGAGALRMRLIAIPRKLASHRARIASTDGPGSAIRIRPVRTEDIPTLVEILRTIDWLDHLNTEAPDVTIATMARHLNMCQANDSHSVLGAESPEGELIGYVAVHWFAYLCAPSTEGFVSDLFVSEGHRSCGVAARLLGAVEELGRERGAGRLMLLNGREWESYKSSFYAHLGWVERDKFANFVLWLGER